jgi:hypothetical protein
MQPTAITTTSATPMTTTVTSTQLPTTVQTTTAHTTTAVPTTISPPKTQEVKAELKDLGGSSSLLIRKIQGVATDASSDERRILKQVLSKVLKSLLAEEAATTTIAVTESTRTTASTTTTEMTTVQETTLETTLKPASEASKTADPEPVTESLVSVHHETSTTKPTVSGLDQGHDTPPEAFPETIAQSQALLLNREEVEAMSVHLADQPKDHIVEATKDTGAQDQVGSEPSQNQQTEDLGKLLSALQASVPETNDIIPSSRAWSNEAHTLNPDESTLATSTVEARGNNDHQATTESTTPEPDFWFNHLLSLTGITLPNSEVDAPVPVETTTATPEPLIMQQTFQGNAKQDTQPEQTAVDVEIAPSRTWTNEFDQLTRLQQLQQSEQLLGQLEAQRQLVFGSHLDQEQPRDATGMEVKSSISILLSGYLLFF